MSKYTLDGILAHLRQELNLTAVKATGINSRFEALCRETESIKSMLYKITWRSRQNPLLAI